jgi:hypothetical protein
MGIILLIVLVYTILEDVYRCHYCYHTIFPVTVGVLSPAAMHSEEAVHRDGVGRTRRITEYRFRSGMRRTMEFIFNMDHPILYQRLVFAPCTADPYMKDTGTAASFSDAAASSCFLGMFSHARKVLLAVVDRLQF